MSLDKMIITIQGTAGSGKGTVARILCEKLGYEYYSVGDFRRKRAKELGLTIEEYNKRGEIDPTTDFEADKWQENLGLTKDNFVIDGRTGFKFIPHSIKLFLYARDEVAAQRIYTDMQKHAAQRINQQQSQSFEEQLALNKERDESDAMRYKKWYNIDDLRDPKHYDLFIDTSNLTVEQEVEKIMTYINNKKNS